MLPFLPPTMPRSVGLVLFLSVMFLAVAGGAYPVVRRLTRRLESLKLGVERFGSGQLDHRVEVSGRDEVAAVASSFNRAASRVEALVHSNRSLLANASHELRSPLARMKMAVSMLDEVPSAQREKLKREIETNVGELDALVEELLLASRLDASESIDRRDAVDLLALAVEEGSRVEAEVDGPSLQVRGDERLLRRALRNLLENARRYGGAEVTVELARSSAGAEVRVCDRGPGVPESLRERIFEPFYRLPGHAEQAGGVGLGLSLVRQIAQRHGGSVRCESRQGGGSCFVLAVPTA
jgi:signal transduction histidine kinase